jgi:N-acyl-D-amino-acid deacylase
MTQMFDRDAAPSPRFVRSTFDHSHRGRGGSIRQKMAWYLLLAFAAGGTVYAQTFDVLIRGGFVIDGTGSPWMRGDVGTKGDRIVAVGKLSNADAKLVVDATGLFVAPGFIDAHSHAWPALSKPETASAEAILTQGITTLFINPDGGGPTDLVAQRRAIDSQRAAVNVALMIGHNSVRSEVLGSKDVTPNTDELMRMAALVRRGFEAGAFGLSAGPFYVPGTFSKTEEHIALARVAAEFDGFYTSHIRDEADYNIGVVAAVDEVIRVAREARLPGIVTHIKVLGPRVWDRSNEIIKHIDAARSEGVEVFADQYPYEASSTGLTAALVPAWAQEGGAGALKGRLANAELRSRIRREMLENLERRAGASNIQIRSHAADPSIEGKRLDAIARARLVESVDAAIDIINAGGAQIVSFNMQEQDIRAFMIQPWTMTCSDGQLVMSSDGVPHPRSFGPFPRKIRRYVIEQHVLTLERAIHSMTGLPASVLRVRDRGIIRPGAFADLAIFDLAAVRDRATYEQPRQLSEGVRHVFVNGQAALSAGKLTAARAGQVLTRVRP